MKECRTRTAKVRPVDRRESSRGMERLGAGGMELHSFGLCTFKFRSLKFGKTKFSNYTHIYIYMPESYWVVHFLAVLKVNRLSTVLSQSHFYSREKHFKS